MNLDVRYELLEKLGSGSYATVYRARDKELGREVAVKQIHEHFLEDPRTLERYWAEAQLLASMQHPNIITVYDIVRDRGWLIMELMQGSLQQRLAGRQMDLRSLRTALAHCLRALKYLHERGVIHGDIKPGNMMIDHRKRVKVGDFGLARRVSDAEGSLLKGTAKYIAPEVVSDEFGEVGPSSDLYSLGFSAYELMCGKDNFENLFPGLSAFGRDRQAAWMMWHAAPDRRLPEIARVLEGVPADLTHVIQKLIEKDPQRRYRSADEALSDLNIDIKLVTNTPGGDEDIRTEVVPAQKSRRPLVLAALAVSLLLSIAMLFVPAGPARYTGPAQTTLGVVRSVDAGQRTLEYEDPVSGKPALLEIAPDATIELIEPGAESRFVLPRDIRPGDWVEIERGADAEGNAAWNLTVSRPVNSSGLVRSVDPAQRRVIVAVKEGAIRDELSLDVPERARLRLNGEPARLEEIRIGDTVEMQHLLDPAGRLGHVLNDLTAKRRVEFAAFVDRVDVPQRELHLSFGRGGGKLRILPLADDAQLAHKSGESLELDDLRAGDRLTVEADDRIHRVTVIREDLQLSGIITSVDAAAGALTVRDSDGTEQRLTLEPQAEITLGLQPALLDDLRTEIDSATVSYSERPDGTRSAAAVDVHRAKRHDRWSLLIGTQAFVDRSVSRLPHATSDAQTVHEALVNRYAVDPDWTLRLYDRTRDEIAGELSRFLGQLNSNAQLIVFVSTQAYVGPDGVVYLAGTDFRLDDMTRTGLPLDRLVREIEKCPAQRKLLLLDIVHDVEGAEAAHQPDLPELLYQLRTPIVETDIIGASGVGERGRVLPEERRGVFADAVARGFSGAADADRNVDITADELFAYLQRELQSADLPDGWKQSPFRLQRSAATPSP